MSEVCFSNSEFFHTCPNCNNCVPPRSVQCPGGVLTCVPTWTPSTRDPAHWVCGGAVQRSVGASVPDDGSQFTVLAGPKDPDDFLGDFRVPLVVYN